MCKKLSVRASCASSFRSVTRHSERPPSVIPGSRFLWLVAFAIGWMMTGYGGIAIGQVVGVDDPSDMADSSGDIKRIEAWVDHGNLNLTMTVYGVFAPSVEDTPAGMTNRYYYHWLLDTDNNPGTGYLNDEYEGNATNLETPIGVDVMIQFGWRNGATNGVYAYALDPLTGAEVTLFEDYEYTIDADTIHAVIPLADLGLTPADIIAVSAFQEGASNDWQCDWIESVVLPLMVVKASNPTPEDGAADIASDVILGWKPGRLAAGHNVYFGTDWADVNDATVPTAENLDVSSFDPGPLDFGQTYYWRIDEVNEASDDVIFRGDVWSFTTEPYAYPITGLTVTASSEQPTSPAIRTIDGSGLNEFDQHGAELEDMWMSTGEVPAWIQFAFDKEYNLHELLVWNANSVLEPFMGFGAKEVTVEYSTDGESWTQLDGVPEFAKATGELSYTADTTISFGGVMAKFVRLTIADNWGDSATQTGLSEVRFAYVPVQAFYPDPADGATGVSVETGLNWRPGREATSHTVYIDTDETAVAEGTAAADTVADHGYIPVSLDFATTYLWKVDESGDMGAFPGDVWSFTTEEFAVVDDFESYTDDIEAETTIWQNWIDGVTNGTGSYVGYETAAKGTFAETTVVHNGRQSMPVTYDNTKSPYYSEAERTFDSAWDWTAHGADTLSLYFQGLAADAGNSAENLYVTVKDSSGKSKTVAHPDPAATTMTEWQQWQIPLTEFTAAGVKTTAVKALVIGVGNRTSPTTGGTGIIYIDDIGYGHPAP